MILYKQKNLNGIYKKVSRIGYGTWPLAGNVNNAIAYGATNDDDSKRALQTAYTNGINLYDTADFYGFGHVEKMLGEVFFTNRNELVLMTKVGLISSDGKTDFSTDHIVKSIERSLLNLKTDYVDVYLLHGPTMDELADGRIISLLELLKLEGKILEYGISTQTPQDVIPAIQTYNFKYIEFNFNIMDQRAKELGILKLCKENDVFSIIRTPLSQGIITGNFTKSTDTSDRRNSMPDAKIQNMISLYERMYGQVINKTKLRSHVALQYCLSQEGVSCVIPGMKFDTEVLENLGCIIDFPLSDSEIQNIETEYQRK